MGLHKRGKRFLSMAVFLLSLIAGGALAGDVYISEFMASNGTTLTNEFGETEDWIELYNDSSSSIDLSGWYLTDAPTELTKWEFPATVLASKSYLLVWASNRDTVENGELHTNFKLDGDGEYLALVRPDGSTIEHEFSPSYPDQKSDVAYGLIFKSIGSDITLSDAQTMCRYLVPATDIGSAWRGLAFADGTWAEGLTPLGYDLGSGSGGATYQAEDFSVRSGCAVQSSHAGFTGTGYMDMGGEGTYFEWNNVDGGSGGTVELSLYYASSSERPCDIRVNGSVVGTMTLPASGGWTKWGVETLDVTLSAGNNTIRVTAATSAGGPNVDKLETSSSVLVGSGPYDDVINTDVEDLMYGNSASVYLRIPFVVDDPGALDELLVRMSYEDGFAAYLNGTSIADANLPAGHTAETLAWNAEASASRDEADAVTMTTVFSTSSAESSLVAGTNVLAVHGLNVDPSDLDLLMQTEVTASLKDGYQSYETAYFATPTPGDVNSGEALGFVGDTKFSMDRGFYTNAFHVAISTETEGATIHYTLDGSTPTEVHGTEYTAPIPIVGTTVLRAVAFRTGWERSDVDTQTYIFPDDVVQQPVQPSGWPTVWTGGYSDYEMDPDITSHVDYAAEFPEVLLRIPTMSVVTDQEHLFGSSGIYDNTTRSGVEWERPASVELIHPDGSKGFQINCGLRIQGGASRITSRSPKHSFRLLFKDIYGAAKLNYDLFDDSPVDSFDGLVLRAGYNNSWIHFSEGQRNAAQYARDQFARRAQSAMGQSASHGIYVHLYVNGLYWGIYNPCERPEASFAAEHLGGDKDEWDATNSGATPFTDGDDAAWNTMVDIATNGLANAADYETFKGYCDVENLADYMIVNHFLGNSDWDHKNWYAARRRRTGDGYQFFCWDSEASLSSESTNTTGIHNQGKPTDLFHHARTNEEFRVMFGDRVHKHLFEDGALTPASTSNLWKKISDELDGAVVAESARWGDWRTNVPYTVNDHYLVEQTHILNHILPARTDVLVGQYTAMGLYPEIPAPEFGLWQTVFTNSISVGLNATNTIYYTIDGTDPRGYGTGAIEGAEYEFEIVLSHSARVKARCFDGTNWSALAERDFVVASSQLVISEIMHSPRVPDAGEISVSGDSADYQFIELYNAGAEPVGLVGHQFVDGVRFDFSDYELLTLSPGEYAVVVRDRAAFLARYPGLEDRIAGEFIGRLSGDGEQVQLLSESGQEWEFSYGDGRDWPASADGAGHSLVLKDPAAQNLSYGGHWKASALIDGSPVAAEPVNTFSIRINEIAGHTDINDPAYPDYDSNDWIELYNAGTSAVSLAGFYLSDDPGDLLKWAIPSSPVFPPSDFLTFDEITGFHSPISSGFGINKAGEQILLTHAPDGIALQVVDSVQFKGQENGVTIGRVPDGGDYWVPTLPTRGAGNAARVPRPVISEVMFHPAGASNEALEYIEIYNPCPAAVELWTMDNGELIGNWRIRGDVDYDFPDGTVISAGQRVLLVSFEPTNAVLRSVFEAHYQLDGSVPMFGNFTGNLSNGGGRITLEKPQAPDAFDDNRSWVIVDELFFSDSSPWKPAADGLGYALHRTEVNGAAADPSAWRDGVASPGAAGVEQPDLNILSFETSATEAFFSFSLLGSLYYELEYSTNLQENIWWMEATLQNQTNYAALLNPDLDHQYFRLKRD